MTTKQTAPVSKTKAPEPKTTVAPEATTVGSPFAAAITQIQVLNGLPQGRGTQALRQAAMLRQQQLHGNSHVLRHLAPTAHQSSHHSPQPPTHQPKADENGSEKLEAEVEPNTDTLSRFSPASLPPPPNELPPARPKGHPHQPELMPRPSTNGHEPHPPIQRTEEGGADEAAPTEEQKAAALAAAQAAEAIANQAQGKGQEETGKSRDAKAKEDKGKETAHQEAADAKGKAEAKNGNETGGEAGPKPMGMKKGGEEGNAAALAPALNGSAPTDKAPASAAEDPGFQGVIAKAKQAGAKVKAHDPADKKAKESQDAAEMPASEVKGRAEQGQAGKIEQAETPAFDAAAFKAKLMAQIEALAPKSAQEADDFKESGKLDGVKGSVQGQVGQEKEKSSQPMESEAAAAPDTGSVPVKLVAPIPDADPGTTPVIPEAEKATPKPKTPAEVEQPITNDAKAMDAKMSEAEVTDEQLEKSNEPEFTGAVAAKKDAKTSAQQSPQGYRQGEEAQIKQAEGEAKATTEQNLAGMQGDKAAALQQVMGKQGDTKGKDEQARQKVGQDIDQIYQRTKGDVEKILNELDGKVEKAFDAGAAAAEKVFEDFVDAKMTAYKEKRYGGMLGWAKWAKDKILGMPGEVNTFYTQGRQLYLQKMDAVIDEVTAIIGNGLTSAKAAVAKGKQEIQDYLSKLPEDLKEVGQQAAQDIQGKFDELEQSIDAKQNDLIDKLAQKYNENLQTIDARIDELKAANKGLVDKAMDAIGGVIKTILELKAMLSSVLAQVADAIGKIIKDPIGFLGNLLSAVKTGLQNFVSNIGTHLKKGLMTWLFGEVAKAGIQLPESFDLKGILTLVLQLLGVTWANLRARAVKMFGEPVVAGLEKAWTVFKIIQEQGIGGLWEYIKDQLSNLKEMVIDGIKDMVITEVIKAGIQWLIGVLGGPAGAFIKAAKAIYDVVMWFVNNGRQLMSLVSAIISSVGAIAAGNIGGAAAFIENALAQAIPTVIGFLASLLGLGGLSEKIKGIIQKIQEPINKAIEWLLGKAKAIVAKLGGKLGFGKKNKDQSSKAGIPDTVVKEPFSMVKESHTLTAKTQSGALEITMASGQPRSLQVMLNNALSEVQQSSRTSSEKAQIVTILKNAQMASNEESIRQDWLIQGARDPQLGPVDFQTFLDVHLARIANQLSALSGFGISSLDDFYSKTPDKRYLPRGYDIRKQLYEVGSGWSSVRDAIVNQEKPEIRQAVSNAIKNNDINLWQELIESDKIPKYAKISSFTPFDVDNVAYDVDHIEPLSFHWNNGGNNNDDQSRWQATVDKSNLRLITASANRSKGGERFNQYVGLNFTSIRAEGNMTGARTIDNMPFTDLAGNPIK